MRSGGCTVLLCICIGVLILDVYNVTEWLVTYGKSIQLHVDVQSTGVLLCVGWHENCPSSIQYSISQVALDTNWW